MPFNCFDQHMFPLSKKTIKDMLSKKGMKKVEVRREVKEVIKRLEQDLIVQANAMNEIRIFVDKLGEYRNSTCKTSSIYVTSRKDDDYYSPINFNHIFHDNDILDEWTRVAEEPLLPENHLDWLDEDNQCNAKGIGKEKHVSSKEKDKQVTFKDKSAQVSSLRKDKHILPSSNNQNDSDDETAKDGEDDNDDDDDDNDGDGNMHKKLNKVIA
ncbi:hypothetical protein Sango_2683600 [Sesamum angolense]|uniref:Uncharacterized protein n=1 Tax=Sesamum angolense TaxID=2727404 RepID=A0AAE2BHK8_9LAMI|nr:hypothetical protein Sango_2683600 [Sesamum angolense]